MERPSGGDSSEMRRIADMLEAYISADLPIAWARRLVSGLSRDQRVTMTGQPSVLDPALLCRAVTESSKPYVTFLVDECHADVNQKFYYLGTGRTSTPLCVAAGRRDATMVRHLVGHGADVDGHGRNDLGTAMMAACAGGDMDTIRLLALSGASVELPNVFGETCLVRAAQNDASLSALCVCAYLIDSQNAFVGAVDHCGNTALHHAIRRREFSGPLIKLLLNNGTDPDIYNLSGDDALLTAALAYERHPKVLDDLVSVLQPTQKRRADLYAVAGARAVTEQGDLQLAVDNWKKVIQYLQHPVDSPQDAPAAGGPNPLFCSSRYLDRKSADADAMHMKALLSLQRVLGPGHSETVRCWTKRGLFYAKYESSYDRGVNMYQIAANACCPTSLHGIDNVDPHVKFSQLFWSNYGADATSVRFDDVVPVLRIATEMNKCPSDLHRHAPYVKHVLYQLTVHSIALLQHLVTSQADSLTLKNLVREMVETSLPTRDGRHALHYAVKAEPILLRLETPSELPSSAVVEELLEAGADVNVEDCAGNTPLHLAAIYPPDSSRSADWSRIVNLLLRHGVHVDLRNLRGQTPFDRLPSGVDKMQHITLQCLAARALRQHGVAYRHMLTKHIADFVARH